MREAKFPKPLQNRILLQSGFVLLAVIVGLGLAFGLKALSAAAPCMLSALLLACDTIRLHHIAVKGRFITLTGTVLNVEHTIWRRRPKALLLEIDGNTLRVVLRNQLLRISVGDAVLLCVSDAAPLCIWFGVRQLASSLTLTVLPEKIFLQTIRICEQIPDFETGYGTEAAAEVPCYLQKSRKPD